MSITDHSTETTEEVFIPPASCGLAIVPQSLDRATVRGSFLYHAEEHPTVVIELRGFHMQTYRCDPHEIAKALRRLADRVDVETDNAIAERAWQAR